MMWAEFCIDRGIQSQHLCHSLWLIILWPDSRKSPQKRMSLYVQACYLGKVVQKMERLSNTQNTTLNAFSKRYASLCDFPGAQFLLRKMGRSETPGKPTGHRLSQQMQDCVRGLRNTPFFSGVFCVLSLTFLKGHFSELILTNNH